MKKNIFITVLFCALLFNNVFAQLTDAGSLEGSAQAAIEYKLLSNETNTLKNRLTSFRREYVKRLQYYVGTNVFKEQIDYKLDEVQSRIDELGEANAETPKVLYYSKNKENVRLLTDIQNEFSIVYSELSNQDWDATIYGEKINLYQNMMSTLTRLHRLLDIVEGNVGLSVKRTEVLSAIAGNAIPVDFVEIPSRELITSAPGISIPDFSGIPDLTTVTEVEDVLAEIPTEPGIPDVESGLDSIMTDAEEEAEDIFNDIIDSIFGGWF